MKITREEFQRIGKERPLELFRQVIKAKETREKYTRTLRHVLCKIFEDILEGDFNTAIAHNKEQAITKSQQPGLRQYLLNSIFFIQKLNGAYRKMLEKRSCGKKFKILLLFKTKCRYSKSIRGFGNLRRI